MNIYTKGENVACDIEMTLTELDISDLTDTKVKLWTPLANFIVTFVLCGNVVGDREIMIDQLFFEIDEMNKVITDIVLMPSGFKYKLHNLIQEAVDKDDEETLAQEKNTALCNHYEPC